jgi:hypothetical protein
VQAIRCGDAVSLGYRPEGTGLVGTYTP